MGHYEELDVTPSATASEIRSSYLALARRFHPDRLADQTPEARAASAARMARINAAWTVLRDEEQRARYDAAMSTGRVNGATVREADDAWRPLSDDDEVDPRLLDDTPTGAPTLRRELTFLPVVLLAAGFLGLVVGFVIGFGPLVGAGLLLMVASGVAFLAIPLIALARSSRADQL